MELPLIVMDLNQVIFNTALFERDLGGIESLICTKMISQPFLFFWEQRHFLWAKKTGFNESSVFLKFCNGSKNLPNILPTDRQGLGRQDVC